MDYYIIDIADNTYNYPIDIARISEIPSHLVLQLAVEEISNADRDELMEAILDILETLELSVILKSEYNAGNEVKGSIFVDKEERAFFIEENSTAAMFVLNTTFDNGTKTTQNLRLKKVVE